MTSGGEPRPLDFDPLTMAEKADMLYWAERSSNPYAKLVIRMARENAWFQERHRKYLIIGEDALDILVEAAMEEYGIAWS